MKLKLNFKQWFILGLLVISAISAGFLAYKNIKFKYFQKEAVYSETVPSENISAEINTISSGVENQNSSSNYPEAVIQIKPAVNLAVPFTSQAPFAKWDELHNEACEEASVLMVYQYLKGDRQTKIPAAEAENQIQKMVSWQIAKIGSHKDLTASETLNYLIKGYFGLSGGQVKSFSVEEIKRELSFGKPVIVPASGRLLGNPNFRRPGPIYHMLVIVGYDSKYFITNDPGTRNGYKYKYTFSVLQNVVHDWNGTPDKINSGQKVYIVLN